MKIKVLIRIDEDTNDQLKAIAKDQDRSVAYICREAIDAYLRHTTPNVSGSSSLTVRGKVDYLK